MTTPTMQEQLAAILANSSATDLLAALVKSIPAADMKAALKKAEAEKPTLLSLTMDAIVSAAIAGQVITDNVCKAVTESGRACGVLTETESAATSSVGALIRYANAYDAALKRAGLDIVKHDAEAPASLTCEGVPIEGESGVVIPDADPEEVDDPAKADPDNVAPLNASKRAKAA